MAVRPTRTAHGAFRRDRAAALLSGRVSLDGEGDLVVILSGRNVDDDQFRGWITPV